MESQALGFDFMMSHGQQTGFGKFRYVDPSYIISWIINTWVKSQVFHLEQNH